MKRIAKLVLLLALAGSGAGLWAQSVGKVVYGDGAPGSSTPDCAQTHVYINSLTGDVYVSAGSPCAWQLMNASGGGLGPVILTGTPTPGEVPTATSSSAATWQTASGGFGLPVPTKTALGFTTAYGVSGTYSQTDTAIGVNFADTVNIGANLEGSLMPYPATAFTYTAILSIMPSSDLSICLGAVASSTGPTEILVQHSSGGTGAPGSTDVEDWNTPTSFNQTVINTQRNFVGGGFLWFRYKDDGTNLFYLTSMDGVNWDTVYTVAKASSFLSSNGGFHYFGVIISTYNGAGGTVMRGQEMSTP